MDGITSSNDSDKREIPHFRITKFFDLLGRGRHEYICTVVASSVMAAADGLVHPLLVRAIFDEVVKNSGVRKLSVLVFEYLTLGLFITVGTAAIALWSKSLENRVVQSVSSRLLHGYYCADYSSVLKNGQGYFIGRIHGDVRDGLVPLLTLVQTTTSQCVLLFSLSTMLVYLSWQASAWLAFLIPISALVGAFVGRRIKMLATQERERDGSVLAILSKALSAFRIVNGFQLGQQTVQVFNERLVAYLSTNYQRYKLTRQFQTLNDLTMVICDFLSLFVGGVLVLRGALSFGSYLAFVNAFWRAATTLLQIVKATPDFHNFGVIVARIHALASQTKPSEQSSGNTVAIHGLAFSYDGVPLLQNLSIQLSPGERLMIVGPNGCGKTTLANILAGYLKPSVGQVTVPRKISAVTLPIFFPPLKVSELVNDTELLRALNLGTDETLQTYAENLSVGQQQKIALCLALSMDADLYIIDEPLASLDQESRDTAINLILHKTRGKNLILIMHGAENYYHLFDRIIRVGPQLGELQPADIHDEQSLRSAYV